MFKIIGKVQEYFRGIVFYTGLINFLILVATAKKVYNIPITNYILIPSIMLIGCFLAIIDYHFIRKHFFEAMNKNNNIKQQLDRIEERLKNGN